MKTILYIDGFNSYYGPCRLFGVRWVNPLAVAEHLLPNHEFVRVRYFSALVKSDLSGSNKVNRQRIYLRALKTLPNLEIQLGIFLQSVKTMPKHPVSEPPETVNVLKTEEKGSDVNLATALLLDAFEDAMECAVVVSNDSDLLGPIQVVRSRFHKQVGIINPQKRPSRALMDSVDFMRQIRRGVVENSLFPENLTDSTGIFHKPPDW